MENGSANPRGALMLCELPLCYWKPPTLFNPLVKTFRRVGREERKIHQGATVELLGAGCHTRHYQTLEGWLFRAALRAVTHTKPVFTRYHHPTRFYAFLRLLEPVIAAKATRCVCQVFRRRPQLPALDALKHVCVFHTA